MRPFRTERDWLRLATLAALLAGAALRFWRATIDPLWLDEAYSAYAADHGFAFLWHVVPRYETHPPFYYALVRVWSLAFGDTLASRRMIGVLAGTAAVGVSALAARQLGLLLRLAAAARVRLVFAATALVALQPMLIQESRQVRPYPVIALVYALGTLAVLRLAGDARDARRLHRGWLAGFALAEALLLWLHTLGPLYAAALALALAAVTIRRGMARGDQAALVATQLVAGLLYLPAFLIMLEQAPTWVHTTWLTFDPRDLGALLGLLYLSWSPVARLLALLLGIAGLVRLLRAGGAGRRAAAALALLALVPPVAAILISILVSPVFLVRTVCGAAIPAALLFAAAISWPRGRMLAAALLLAPVAAEAALDREFALRPPAEDWYGAIDWLRPRFGARDTIWAYPNDGALPLHYALRDRGGPLPVRPIPGPVPAFGLGGHPLSGSQGVVSLDPAEIAALVRTPAATVPDTIWLMQVGPWNYDPGDRMLHALLTTRRVTGRYRVGEIALTGLRRRDR